jgi:hypothetical protein
MWQGSISVDRDQLRGRALKMAVALRGLVQMASLVQELEQGAYDCNASLSDLLRKAKSVAVKLRLAQPVEWVEAELNGYRNGSVPDYRRVVGKAKTRNPFHGWQPLMFGDSEFERMVCEFPIGHSVREIEHLLQTPGEASIALDGEQVSVLCRMAGMPTLPISVFFSSGSLVSILNTVRNKVLDWSLSLQTDGIMGEGMSFRPEEKIKASSNGDTYNIGSIGNFAGNLGGKVGGNLSAKSTQEFARELEKAAILVGQLRQYQGEMGLDANQQANVSRSVDCINEELNGVAPRASVISTLLKSIKSTVEGAAGNLIASGVIAAIQNINL